MTGRFSDMQKNAERMLWFQGDSTINEKMFQNSADQQRDAANKRLSPASMLRRMVQSKLLTEEYQLGTACNVNDIPDDEAAKKSLPTRIFEIKKRESSMPFKDLSTLKSAPSFTTCHAEGWKSIVTEQKFERWCWEHRLSIRLGNCGELKFARPRLFFLAQGGQVSCCSQIFSPRRCFHCGVCGLRGWAQTGTSASIHQPRICHFTIRSWTLAIGVCTRIEWPPHLIFLSPTSAASSRPSRISLV